MLEDAEASAAAAALERVLAEPRDLVGRRHITE